MEQALIIHPQTARLMARFVGHPSHALVLVGPEGSGKRSLARDIARQLLDLGQPDGLDGYPYLKPVTAEQGKSSIGIEAVRELQHFAKLKLPDAAKRRIILITDAHQLTTEAQNALLKLVEEPPADMLILMTASSEQQLLPTILSRVQLLPVQRPARHDIETYFTAMGHSPRDVGQAYLLSGGLPGLMSALLEDADHPLKRTVELARQLLQTTQFERLAKVDALSKDKSEALQLIFVLQHMAQAAIEQAAAKADQNAPAADRAIRQWHRVRQACHEAEEAYEVSAQAKLTLTHLMLSI